MKEKQRNIYRIARDLAILSTALLGIGSIFFNPDIETDPNAVTVPTNMPPTHDVPIRTEADSNAIDGIEPTESMIPMSPEPISTLTPEDQRPVPTKVPLP
jgi:hypothetical protein